MLTLLPRRVALISMVAGLAGLTMGPWSALAQQPDITGAEIALWKVVVKSRDPADYTAFLLLFPEGHFSALARIKLAKLQGAPPPAGAPDVTDIYHLDITPKVAFMGQNVTVKCRGFAAPALYDRIVVVKAGDPDFDGAGKVDEKRLYWNGLPNLYDCAGTGIALPMMMKGSYEVRYISRQYNPDGELQVVARSGFENK